MPIENITLGPELAKAMVAAYSEFTPVKKDAENPYYHSHYATLAACRNATAPALAKHGLLLMQNLKTAFLPLSDGTTSLATECFTILLHESGQGAVFGPFTLPAGQPTAQSLGSAATFARRYAHNGITNIVADDDDDGEEASKPAEGTRAPHGRPPLPASNGLPPRPTGLFGYGKKFVDTPWNVMATSQLEWFRDADRTPVACRDRCRAELAWREHESLQLDAARTAQADADARAGLDDKIPF